VLPKRDEAQSCRKETHESSESICLSKKQSTKAIEKKPVEKAKRTVNGGEARFRSQARKNQSEKKFRKAYGEDDYGESEEELAQGNTAENS
jgi:hypothetical protein